VDPPTKKELVAIKWVYKTKYAIDGSIQKNKERLVAKGFSQQPGIYYDETYVPIAILNTIRIVLALATKYKWLVY